MVDIFCSECGCDMVKVGQYKNTRSYKCTDCFAEKVQFIASAPCKHEYNDKNGNKCVQCGEPNP